MRCFVLTLALLAGCKGGDDDKDPTDGSPTDDTETTTGDDDDDTTSTGSTVEVTIGAAGGTLTVGDVTLEVPAGALTEDTVITAVPLATPPDPADVVAGWDFGPDGLQFAVPATLTVEGAPAPAADERLSLSWYDEDGGAWVDLPSTTAGDVVSAEVEHFTSFALRRVGVNLEDCDLLPPACGGDLVGTWSIDSMCLEWTEPTTTTGTGTKACTMTQNITADASGDVTFEAGGAYSSTFSVTLTIEVEMPPECFASLPIQVDCSRVQQGCVGRTDTGCSCTTVITDGEPEAGTWATNGTEVTFTDALGDPDTGTYCVVGDALVLSDQADKAEDPNVVYVLSR